MSKSRNLRDCWNVLLFGLTLGFSCSEDVSFNGSFITVCIDLLEDSESIGLCVDCLLCVVL